MCDRGAECRIGNTGRITTFGKVLLQKTAPILVRVGSGFMTTNNLTANTIARVYSSSTLISVEFLLYSHDKKTVCWK